MFYSKRETASDLQTYRGSFSFLSIPASNAEIISCWIHVPDKLQASSLSSHKVHGNHFRLSKKGQTLVPLSPPFPSVLHCETDDCIQSPSVLPPQVSGADQNYSAVPDVPEPESRHPHRLLSHILLHRDNPHQNCMDHHF